MELGVANNSIQDQLLGLTLEVKLFKSLINNKIKTIKADINDTQCSSDDDNYCRFLMTISENLRESPPPSPPTRKTDVLDWIFPQVLRCISTDSYSGFWPSHEMARCLLNENSKTKFCESEVFMNLVTVDTHFFIYFNFIHL